MAYSTAICDRITAGLDGLGIKNYTLDREKELIRFNLSADCKLKSVRVTVDLREDKYLTFFSLPMDADEASYNEIVRLINLINYDLVFGSFEMDERDGEIRFRFAVDCDGVLPSSDVVERSLVLPVVMIERYGDAIARVLMGFGTAKEAYAEAKAKAN